MRIACFSDIHGHYDILEKTLSVIDNLACDKILFLGDSVGKGPDSYSCFKKLQSTDITMLQGNWEMYINRGTENFIIENHDIKELSVFCEKLTDEDRNFIANLPFSFEMETGGKRLLFMHYLIKDIDEKYPFYPLKTLKNGEFELLINDSDYDFHVFGHAHRNYTYKNSVIVPSVFNDTYEVLVLDINSNGVINYEFHKVDKIL